MKLYLIRHGISTANIRKVLSGITDVSLAPEAYPALDELKGKGIYPVADGKRLITSGMKRTEETCRAIFGDIPHESIAAFHEISFGDFEMHPYSELESDPRYLKWLTDETGEVACPNGESWREAMTERVMPAMTEVIADGRDTIIVCHGAIIAAMMWTWFQSERERLEWLPKQGRGYCVDIPNDMKKPASWREI